jgi:hypothetical protein
MMTFHVDSDVKQNAGETFPLSSPALRPCGSPDHPADVDGGVFLQELPVHQ